MFKLKHLKGRTYVFMGPTNVGVYKINDYDCILIDTCHFDKVGDRLLKALKNNFLNPVAIVNTHFHGDHIGANKLIKKNFRSKIYSPTIEDFFVNNVEFYPLFVFSAKHFSFMNKFKDYAVSPDFTVASNQEEIEIENIKLRLMNLKGHTPNQKGIVTPDNVIFIGDSVVGDPVIDVMKFIYTFNLQDDFETKSKLIETNYDLYVPSHGNVTNNIEGIIKKNIDNIMRNMDFIRSSLEEAKTMEELMQVIYNRYGYTQELVPYYVFKSCIMSYISYIENSGEIEIVFKNHIPAYKLK